MSHILVEYVQSVRPDILPIQEVFADLVSMDNRRTLVDLVLIAQLDTTQRMEAHANHANQVLVVFLAQEIVSRVGLVKLQQLEASASIGAMTDKCGVQHLSVANLVQHHHLRLQVISRVLDAHAIIILLMECQLASRTCELVV